MSFVAFDLGGSGGKLFMGHLGERYLELEKVHTFPNAAVAANGGMYWNLWGIYDQLNQGLRRANLAARGRIESLGIDSFSNDFAFLDANGEVLTPLRCYRDKRTERHWKAIFSPMDARRLYELTGNQIAPFNCLMQLAAMRLAGQGHILENSYKLLFTPDLLVNFLTGEFVTEFTIASVSQMLDIHRGSWSREILEAFTIPERLFGRLVPSGTIIGNTRPAYNREIGSQSFKVVSVCEHDTASAFIASAISGEHAIISCGTWSLVGTETDRPVITDEGFRYNIANEAGFGGRNRLLRNVMGLWIIQEIRAAFERSGQIYTFAEMVEAGRQAPAFVHSIDPDAPDFFAPDNMLETVRTKCLSSTGELPRSVGELVRCVEESLAFKYRWAIERIEALSGRRLPLINIIGGGSTDSLLCQFIAEACGRPVVAGPENASALGNILVQLLALGLVSSLESGRRLIADSFPTNTYTPREAAVWDEHYAIFKRNHGLEAF